MLEEDYLLVVTVFLSLFGFYTPPPNTHHMNGSETIHFVASSIVSCPEEVRLHGEGGCCPVILRFS